MACSVKVLWVPFTSSTYLRGQQSFTRLTLTSPYFAMIYFDKYIAHLTMGNAILHVQSFSSTEGKKIKNGQVNKMGAQGKKAWGGGGLLQDLQTL